MKQIAAGETMPPMIAAGLQKAAVPVDEEEEEEDNDDGDAPPPLPALPALRLVERIMMSCVCV